MCQTDLLRWYVGRHDGLACSPWRCTVPHSFRRVDVLGLLRPCYENHVCVPSYISFRHPHESRRFFFGVNEVIAFCDIIYAVLVTWLYPYWLVALPRTYPYILVVHSCLRSPGGVPKFQVAFSVCILRIDGVSAIYCW